MPKILKIFSVFLLAFISVNGYSQGEIDEQAKVMLKNEKTGVVFLTSNGMGAGYRFGKRINARNQTIYDIELMNVKHPKEIRLTSNYNYYTTRSFVFGKQNNFFELKGNIGKQYEMYRKNDKGGISVRYFYSTGPTIGILKPIYYDIRYYAPPTYPPQPNYETLKTEKFNISIHQSNIRGRSSFFKGFDELTIVPGATAKAGFSFEYSREDAVIHAIEVALGLDVFPKSIPIMATQTNNFYFLNMTVGYRFGKVIDVSDAALSKGWKEKRKEQKLSRSIAKDQKKSEGLKDF